jgi:hypothetical protein
MKAALQFSPLQVTNYGHCFTVIGYEEGVLWRTFDTYGECSGTLPWSYKFYSAMAHYVSPVKPPNPIVMQFTEGVLYQLVEGKGGFFLFAAGKLRKDDTALLLASWEVRNGGDTKGKVGTLTLANLEGVELFDLKGQPTSL